MKVVINSCYGGFGISAQVIKKLVELGSEGIKIMEPKEYYGGNNENFKHRDWEAEWQKDFATYIDIGNGFKAHPYNYNIYKDGKLYDYEGSRHNPDFIDIVEKLGPKAYGSHATLKIVEIPDDVEYIIEEYDGQEWISEQHRTWS